MLNRSSIIHHTHLCSSREPSNLRMIGIVAFFPVTPTSNLYTIFLYRRFGFSTLRNSSALKLLSTILLGYSISELLVLSLISANDSPSILSLILNWLACLLRSPAGSAEKTLYLLFREKLKVSLPQKLSFSYTLSVYCPFPPRIWNHKLMSDVPTRPYFWQW